MVQPLWEPLLQLADRSPEHVVLLLRKMLVKWWTRTSCTLLPRQRLAPWRYQRGQRALLHNNPCASSVAMVVGDKENATPEKLESCGGDVGSGEKTFSTTDPPLEEEDLFDVPDQVEDAMGRILEALSHSSTIVRWSAAKGVGRITERLPALCAQDVLDELLTLFEDPDKDRCWHGACLALAELARRGLLLPSRLGDVVPRIVRAVHYDRRRGPTSVGAHVRDAACYTYWAFARAYSPSVLRPYLHSLNESIVLTSLFDREVNCRRAASAAFQEAVGRQGATNFPHGIEILTTADYFSLGNRNDAYLSIARKIAEFEEHRRPIVRHLSSVKLAHWDENIRELAAKSLRGLTPLDATFICTFVLPNLLEKCLDVTDLHTRHGAALGTAEILLALSEHKQIALLSDETVKTLVGLVPAIEKKRLYRGRGGEIMRSAVCRLVGSISMASLPLDVREQVRLLDTVDANIPHPSEPISEAACRALESLLTYHFPVGDKGPSERLQKRVVDQFVEKASSSDNPAVTRGYVMALGHLPAKLLAPNKAVLTKVVECLRHSSRHTSMVGGEGDAETRRNALHSLIRILETVDLEPASRRSASCYPVTFMDATLISEVFGTFLGSLDDYNSDRRGDVGSWCRLVAMNGATDLLLATTSDSANSRACYLTESDATSLAAALLKQLSERLDTVRQRAGDCLVRLLQSPKQVVLSRKSALIDALKLSDPSSDRNWKDAANVFPKVLEAASLPEILYFENVLAGISFSIGSRGEKVGNLASTSLLQWTKQLDTKGLEQLADCLLRLLQTNRGNGRVTLPVLKTLDALFSHRCLEQLAQESATFSEQCLDCLQSEAYCKDVSRLFAVADVTTALLFASPGNTSVTARAMAFLCSLLAHPFPRVRGYTAEQFYMFLVDYDGDQRTKAIELVLETPWSSELQTEQRRTYANQTANELGVSMELNEIISK